jgi:hypothetical protein
MKAWSAALASEASAWPGVKVRPMFGFTALYCKDRIFAALPRTRGMGTPNSLAFKFADPSPAIVKKLEADIRIRTTVMQKTCWFTFEIPSDSDLRDALQWLNRAYEGAGRAQVRD